MAHYVIVPRGGKYLAQVRVKKAGKLIHSEAQTFAKRTNAVAWAKRRAVELEAPGAIQAATAKHITYSTLIGRYIEELGDLARMGRSKTAALDALRKTELSERPVFKLRVHDYVEHVRGRRAAGTGPATVRNDLVWLRVIARTARAAWGVDIDLRQIDDAMHWTAEHGLVARARRRERRPTEEELRRLDAYFRRRRSGIPMADIMWFAVHSARRQAEITRLLWRDQDEAARTGVVRDLKHPREKGLARTFKYTEEALAIVARQPRLDGEPRIFPYDPKTIGAYFADAVRTLEIPDLRFHDLRHEATSRLFERGHSIVEVQQFTLHESWDMLRRYTHLRP